MRKRKGTLSLHPKKYINRIDSYYTYNHYNPPQISLHPWPEHRLTGSISLPSCLSKGSPTELSLICFIPFPSFSMLFHAFPAHQLTLYIINNPVHSHKYCLPGFAVAAETERVPHWDRRPANAGALRATFRTSCWTSKNLSRFPSDEHDILWIFRNPAPVDKSFITLFINFIRFLPCCRMSSIHSMIETYWDRHHVSEAPVASQCQDLQRRSGASGCRENGQWWTGMGYYLDITWYPLVN